VRGADGRFWAHPWPTWSRFFFDETGGSWDVQCAVLLKGIFFLEQSPTDRCEPADGGQTVCYLLALAEQISWAFLSELDSVDVRKTRLRTLDAVCNLVRSVPAYRLGVTLEGAFWNNIESALQEEAVRPGECKRTRGGTGTPLPESDD